MTENIVYRKDIQDYVIVLYKEKDASSINQKVRKKKLSRWTIQIPRDRGKSISKVSCIIDHEDKTVFMLDTVFNKYGNLLRKIK